jgi:hypothetical protein
MQKLAFAGLSWAKAGAKLLTPLFDFSPLSDMDPPHACVRPVLRVRAAQKTLRLHCVHSEPLATLKR